MILTRDFKGKRGKIPNGGTQPCGGGGNQKVGGGMIEINSRIRGGVGVEES